MLRMVSQWPPGRTALLARRAILPPPPFPPREIANPAYFGRRESRLQNHG